MASGENFQISSNQSEIDVETHRNKISINKLRNVFHAINLFKCDNFSNRTVICRSHDVTTNMEDYRIAICQDGKFAVTFDTANLRIRILENTDHRSFRRKRRKREKRIDSIHDSDEINKTIAYFKITNDLDIDKIYETDFKPPLYNESRAHESRINDDSSKINVIIDNKDCGGSDDIMSEKVENEEYTSNNNDKSRWSFDISNMQCKNNGEYFIFVAVSRIDINEDMRGTNNEDNEYVNEIMDKSDCKKIAVDWSSEKPKDVKIDVFNYETKKGTKGTRGTVIYCIRVGMGDEGDFLKMDAITCYYFGNISGICRFVEDSDDLDLPGKNVEQKNKKDQKKRFLLLNFYGIYNFERDDNFNFNLNERFNYPKSIRSELDYWFTKKDCTKRLLSCIYDEHLLVRQYKNDVQSLEVYDLTEMKLKTTAKYIEKSKLSKKHTIFAISKLQFCFTHGYNSVKLYFLENGLEVASKSFDEIDKIYSLEFFDSDEKLLIIGKSKDSRQVMLIVWDLYYTGKVEPIASDNLFITKETKDRLAITSGNILQIDDKGNVTSVLKKIESELKRKQSGEYLNIEYENLTNGEVNKSHIIHLEKNINFRSLVDENEPWVIDDYEREIYCLYHDDEKDFKLIVGRSTVQIWHREYNKKINNGEPFLEYIWTNGIPVNQEREATKLRIEELKYSKVKNNDQNNNQDALTLDNGINDFYLKVYWYERISNEEFEKKDVKLEEMNEDIEIALIMETKEKRKIRMKRKEKVIRWREKVSAVRHACRALDHLNRRTKFLRNNCNKEQKYEELIMYIEYIIWRFVKHKPDQFILLDVRHNVMKNLIFGDCDYLIKFILFGDDIHIKDKYGNEKRELPIVRHIPRSISWPGKKYIKDKELDDHERSNLGVNDETIPENDMELAIYHCKGRELKDTIIVAYFLEYYSGRATGHAGWMDTVSKALPLLFKYNYDDYAKKLFRKECFADQDHFSAQDPFEIIPKQYLVRRNHNIKFRAFNPIVKLQSDKFEWRDRIWNFFKHTIRKSNNDLAFKHKMYKYIEDFDNDLGKSPLALRVVPLPGFTMNNIPHNETKYNLTKRILNIIWFLFIPRWYKIDRNEKNKLLSPFSRVVHYENNDDIYDNPATEAVIDFRWKEARNYFIFLFIRFLIFTSCFIIISWSYLVHDELSKSFQNSLVIIIMIFYYLAIYLFVTELIQLFYHGPRYYINIFNILDVLSVVLPVTVTTFILKNFQYSNGFESVESVDRDLMVSISFSIFILWIELILYFRLISIDMALYIYYVLIIFKAVFPFILFLLIVIIAFAHAMFILLRDPEYDILKNSTYSGIATDMNETFNVTLQADFDPTSRTDNPFSSFYAAIEASYFWISGEWVQRDHFDFWAVEVFSLIASIFLVIILQNMLIAFMGGVYETAEKKGRQTLLRYRANQIAEYEAMHHIHFRCSEPEPKYIYYVGQSKNFEEWYDVRKHNQSAIYRDFEEKSTFTKRTLGGSDYDDVSIWKYKVLPDDIQEEIEKLKIEMDSIVKKLDNLHRQKQS